MENKLEYVWVEDLEESHLSENDQKTYIYENSLNQKFLVTINSPSLWLDEIVMNSMICIVATNEPTPTRGRNSAESRVFPGLPNLDDLGQLGRASEFELTSVGDSYSYLLRHASNELQEGPIERDIRRSNTDDAQWFHGMHWPDVGSMLPATWLDLQLLDAGTTTDSAEPYVLHGRLLAVEEGDSETAPEFIDEPATLPSTVPAMPPLFLGEGRMKVYLGPPDTAVKIECNSGVLTAVVQQHFVDPQRRWADIISTRATLHRHHKWSSDDFDLDPDRRYRVCVRSIGQSSFFKD